MKLYVCYGTWTALGHPCGKAAAALAAAGYRPEIVRSYGNRHLPDFPFNLSRGRRAVKRLTGAPDVPVLVVDDDTVVGGSERIVAWARANPPAR